MKKFSPLEFLASLGAGGIAIIPFAYLQYTTPNIKGLVKIADISHATQPFWNNLFFHSLEAVMIVFTLLHLAISAVLFVKLYHFVWNADYKEYIMNPLSNAGILAPFISAVMTMNVFIGPIRYLFPVISDNLQSLMLPAFVVWMTIFVLLMRMEIKLLKTAFVQSFDIQKITFGWLLHPFALGMLTVTGTGFAAIAQSSSLAHTAAFFSFISGSMGLFLLALKLISVFQKHFASQEGLGAKHFLPSFLIVIPNITLYAISAFRIGHYLEKHHAMHLDSYFLLVITIAFAFETWYLIFGMTLLKDYFKKHYFKKEFYVTQWGLICPFVAYAVLGSFVISVFVASPIFHILVMIFMVLAITFYVDLLLRHLKCSKVLSGEIECSS